jgi:Domain of unknown function (DUF5615)
MDVHVPGPIAQQLRRRGVDLLTAQEDGHDIVSDDRLLERATTLGRIVFTQDVMFRVLAEEWQWKGREFCGLLFGPQLGASIGQYVEDLELVLCYTLILGYTDLSFVRASLIFICHSTPRCV